MPIDKLRYGTTDLLFLAILAKNPTYGYDLWEKLNTLPLHFSQALVYQALARLAAHGHLTRAPHDDEGRIHYSVSAKGRNHLKSEISKWRDLSAVLNTVIKSFKGA